MKKEIQTLSSEFLKTKKYDQPKGDYPEVEIDLKDVKNFSNDLLNYIINEPEDTLEILEDKLNSIFGIKHIRVRLINYRDTIEEIKIRNIRTKHIGKLILFSGFPIQVSDVRPQVVEAKFECPSCKTDNSGTIISVTQVTKVFTEPSMCSCGRKEEFNLFSKTMIDAQRIVVAEESGDPEENGSQRISVFLKENLTDPEKMVYEKIGKTIIILGILREVPIPLPSGSISTRFDLCVDANNFTFDKD